MGARSQKGIEGLRRCEVDNHPVVHEEKGKPVSGGGKRQLTGDTEQRERPVVGSIRLHSSGAVAVDGL